MPTQSFLKFGGKTALCLARLAACCLPLLGACSAQTPPKPADENAVSLMATPLVITGLETLRAVDSSIAGEVAELKTANGALSIKATGLRGTVTVAPFSDALAQQVQTFYAGQHAAEKPKHSARFFRRLQPFGMVQSVAVTRNGASLPWLSVQTNATSGQKVLADWSVLHTQGRWVLQHLRSGDANQAGQSAVVINTGTPLLMTEHGQRWCLHTLSSSQQPADLSLLDWVLIQQTDATRVCQPG